MAKNKKIAKKDIEKFAQKVIARFTATIVEAVFSKIENDPELKQEYFNLCGLGDMVEELPAKPAKAEKTTKKVKPTKSAKATKTEKPAKEVKTPEAKTETKKTKKNTKKEAKGK